jgi:hypothetical protein
MKNEIVRLLPLIQTGQISKAEAEVLLHNIRKTISNDPSGVRSWGHTFA